MFGQFSARVVSFFIRHWILFSIGFIGLIGTLFSGIQRLHVEEDIYAIFPKGQEYSVFQKIIQKNKLNQQLIFSIAVQQDDFKNEAALFQIETGIKNSFKGRIARVKIYQSVDQKKLINYLQSAGIAGLTNQDYQKIKDKLSPDSLALTLKKTSEQLKSSNGIFLKYLLAKDPLGLINPQLKKLNPINDSSAYHLKDELLFTKDETRILFFSDHQLKQKDTKKLVQLKKDLDSFKKRINRKNPSLKFDYFGTFEIAVENAVQVKKDTFITTILGLGAILLLLMLFFRSVLAPLYFILPALFGMISGAGLIGFFHPSISAISLATSSVLLGIVLDYSFHFFAHYKHTGNLIDTVKSISGPLFIGSFTTIAALAALLFTHSVVLQNFGLIALFTLGGSAVFTVFFLPVLLHLFRLKLPKESNSLSRFKLSKKVTQLSLLVIIIITSFFIFNDLSIKFDGDLNNLSYHSEALKEKEKYYTGIHPAHIKKFYVVVSGNSKEKALTANFKLFNALSKEKSKLKITELLSIAPYLISQKDRFNAQDKWRAFWNNKKEIAQQLPILLEKEGFAKNAFDPFTAWVTKPTIDPKVGEALIKDLGLDKLYHANQQSYTLITSVSVDRSNLAECKDFIHKHPQATILDITEIAEKMLADVKDDFNFLLLFSALIVFITLLIVYGRIELALYAFFPMIMGWIWILGISSFFNIPFNFVNIVISTFIFGLGDDFSIFITDGMIHEHKTGKGIMGTYKSAIILSGLTTIIGTGVLLFAQHPAIHSIALISVIGISSILLITLYIQPIIFNFFVSKRVKQKKTPITLFILLYSCLLFTYFIVGSIILSVLLIVCVYPLPIAKKRKQKALNFVISKLAKSTLYAGVHVSKKIINKEKLNLDTPKILIANHSSFLDILMVLMVDPRVLIMVKSWVYNSPVFGLFIRYAGYPFAEEGSETNLAFIQSRIDDGYSIAIFPEGTRSKDGEIKRFHKGAFYLSKALNVPIQPLLLIGAHEVNAKNDFMINSGELIVVVIDELATTNEESYSEFSKRATQLMRTAYEQEKLALTGTNFWQSMVLKNYLYKDPTIEWYVKIKWWLERKNFAYYDSLAGLDGVVYDFGCGYGYLSYYLHYKSKKRSIIASDYDETKITVAANGMHLNTNLHFLTADIRTQAIKPFTLALVNDVLHYLTPKEQQDFLVKLGANCIEGGTILIRDGEVQQLTNLKRTQLTEWLSTKVFKFNKTSNSLNFISSEEINKFALNNNFSLEKKLHSKFTSNVLWILKKQA